MPLGNRFAVISVILVTFLLVSCASLKITPPGADTQSLLVIPVEVTNDSERSQHGFYYIYEIWHAEGSVGPYEAVIKPPLKGGMLIVDSLPPGDYIVQKFSYKPVGAGDFSYGQNVFPRNDRFTLEASHITIFSQSLQIRLYTRIPGRGQSTSYSMDINPVTMQQRQGLLKTLSELENFDSWKVRDN